MISKLEKNDNLGLTKIKNFLLAKEAANLMKG